ncbi:hypothetical protein F4703DRAFT_1727255 [Phycomyces blakesleeanus]
MSVLPWNLTSQAVCNTPACLKVATSIISDMDLTIDPCSDFYQYTCGSWAQKAIIPDDHSGTGTFETLQDNNTEVLQRILEGSYETLINGTGNAGFTTTNVDKENFAKLQNYYKSCLDEASIDSLGPTPVYGELAALYHIFENGEGLVSFPQYTSTLTQALVFMFKQGIEPVQSLYIDADDKNPNSTVISLAQPDLGLPSKEYYEDQEALKKYQSGLVFILKRILGPTSLNLAKAKELDLNILTDVEIDTLVSNAIELETSIANSMVKSQDLLDPVATYNPESISSLQQSYPFLDWTAFLEEFLPPGEPLPPAIIVTSPVYLQRLTGLLQNTPKQKLRDYFVMRHAISKVYALDKDTRTLLQEMRGSIFSGTTKLPPRAQVCTKSTSSTFGFLAGRYFVLRAFGGESERAQVEKFVDLIQSSWLKRLPELDWLDAQTRSRAISKMSKIKHKLGYSIKSPDIRSDENLKEYYQNINITTTSFYDNENSATAWELADIWSRMGKPIDKARWMMDAQEVNAYYTRTGNEIVVPAGILREPFYDPDVPDYLNYGGIGMVIGHEFSHALDNAGRMFNGDGQLEQWWTNSTLKSFETAAQCYVKQYDQWTIEGQDKKQHPVNGNLTLSENLADNGGLSVAYMAYQQLASNASLQTATSNTVNMRLPGLEQLSPEALFFVNFGRVWCNKKRPSMAEQLLLTDVHSPNRVRVNAAIQNSEEFARVFQCPANSPMNPIPKCQLW